MRFDRHNEFITVKEQDTLIKWFDENIDGDAVFKDGLSRKVLGYKLRRTTRQNKNVVYPDLVSEIFDRIIELYGVQYYQKQNVSNGGVIAVATFPGGDTYLHTDPRAQNSLNAVTFNILIQAAEQGGVLSIGEPLVEKEIEERELHCYAASTHQHEVSEVAGSKNRYMLIFRMALPNGVFENV